MTKIINPILKGFNPDPSIVRVKDDYYIATSTFEWFPGVQIHHSKDLVHWKLVAKPLNRVSMLDMDGIPCSGGIWAPCLTYCEADGLFYLIFTNVKSSAIYKDTHNYLTTCATIDGEWSKPVYMNSSGFDPSIFHDDDGKKWFVNMIWDHRQDRNMFGGILLQEYDPKAEKLVGPIKNIWPGTELGGTEAPHLYKRNGYYYLMVAEGGTEWNHAVSLARSKNIEGPYETHPNNPILTAANNQKLPLQRAGHASWVETQNGKHYLAFLCGRPLGELGRPLDKEKNPDVVESKRGRCTLGRETALQEFYWGDDDWLHNKNENKWPDLEVNAPGLPEHPFEPEPTKDDFDAKKLNIHLNTLRIPASEEWCSLTERDGYVRLKGRSPLTSTFDQSLLARRVQSFVFEATAKVDFVPDISPDAYQQMAGLVCIYNIKHWMYSYISRIDDGKRMVNVVWYNAPVKQEPLGADGIVIPDEGEIFLRAQVNYDTCQFAYSLDGSTFKNLGPALDYSILSDDYIREQFYDRQLYSDAFTGSFVGISCQDLTGRKKHADFDFFEYVERE